MLRLEPRLTTIRTLAFSPDNRYLLAVGAKSGLGGLLTFSRLALYDLANPAATSLLRIEGLDPIAGFFLTDGRVLGVDDRGSWLITDVNGTTAPQRGQLDISGRFEPVAVSPDGRWVALVGRREFVCAPIGEVGRRRWWSVRAATGREVSCAASSQDGRVASGQIGPEHTDGESDGELGTGSVYETDTGRPVALQARTGHVQRLAWSPDGRFLVALARVACFRVCTPPGLESVTLRYRSYIRLV